MSGNFSPTLSRRKCYRHNAVLSRGISQGSHQTGKHEEIAVAEGKRKPLPDITPLVRNAGQKVTWTKGSVLFLTGVDIRSLKAG